MRVNKLHKLLRYAKKIDRTHKGLGNLVAFSLLCMKARKFLLIVSVAGSGKSTAMKHALNYNNDGKFVVQEFTRSGLTFRQKELTGFSGCVMVEDLGNVDTPYSLRESIKCAVSLCYDGELSKLNASTDLNITGFKGSAITSIQPVKMNMIINSSDWEAVMRDKTIRYYHMKRPAKPNMEPIKVVMDWGKETKDVKLGGKNKKLYKPLEILGLNQWGRSRVNEHMHDFLKASAALDGRLKVTGTDYKTLQILMKPMTIENHLLEKEGFESDKHFLDDAMCMLTELASYKPLHRVDIATDFGVHSRTVTRLLGKVPMLYTPDPHNKEILYASKEAKEILDESGFWY